jgi:hypothetical protein
MQTRNSSLEQIDGFWPESHRKTAECVSVNACDLKALQAGIDEKGFSWDCVVLKSVGSGTKLTLKYSQSALYVICHPDFGKPFALQHDYFGTTTSGPAWMKQRISFAPLDGEKKFVPRYDSLEDTSFSWDSLDLPWVELYRKHTVYDCGGGIERPGEPILNNLTILNEYIPDYQELFSWVRKQSLAYNSQKDKNATVGDLLDRFSRSPIIQLSNKPTKNAYNAFTPE